MINNSSDKIQNDNQNYSQLFPFTPDPWKTPGMAVGTGNGVGAGLGVGNLPGA